MQGCVIVQSTGSGLGYQQTVRLLDGACSPWMTQREPNTLRKEVIQWVLWISRFSVPTVGLLSPSVPKNKSALPLEATPMSLSVVKVAAHRGDLRGTAFLGIPPSDRCSPRCVLIAARKHRCLSSRETAGRFTVVIATVRADRPSGVNSAKTRRSEAEISLGLHRH